MATLTLKNVPQALLARLKARAKANGRSLDTEILTLVRKQLDTPGVDIADDLRALLRLVAALPTTEKANSRPRRKTPATSGRRRRAKASRSRAQR